jgi:putrescine transport system ATP-binding protein
VAGFIGSVNSFDATVIAREKPFLRLSVPALGGEVLARDIPEVIEGQAVTLAIRPEKLRISKDRPEGLNTVSGHVKDLAYFGKDSLYRIALPGALISAHAVNARRGDEGARVADWDDEVWLSFDPMSAIVLVS